MFSEAVARVVVARIPDVATVLRTPAARKGKVYIDYLQLGQGKTIAAPFAVRPQPGAPVSAPLKWNELRSNLDPRKFNIKTMPRRMTRLGEDPFLGALTDQQEIEPALPKVESMLHGKRSASRDPSHGLRSPRHEQKITSHAGKTGPAKESSILSCERAQRTLSRRPSSSVRRMKKSSRFGTGSSVTNHGG